MFDGNPFFIIPIYRCSEKKYSEELEQKRENLRQFFKLGLPKALKNTYNFEPLVEKSLKWKCWKYNEAIGFIELYILGDQIRGTLYFLDSKKVRKDIKNKKIVESGKLFELSTHHHESSDIFSFLMQELNQIQLNNPKLKHRYIDFLG